MKKPALFLALIALALPFGVATADVPPAEIQSPGPSAPDAAEPAIAAEPSPAVIAVPGSEAVTPRWAAKPPRETCPGQFDISRLASWEECTLAACNQWCVEEGASYSAYEVWISWGICGCRCCP